ncbi:MAG: hypothetical protein GX428_08225 [Candidatus Atribacteria bacterium]|nr:hypothetical protein [Candidatus Atribacteria bacterium]
MAQIVLTPAAGKRLIAKAMAAHPNVQSALYSGMVVIVAGTTNGYVAEEILALLGQSNGFNRKCFYRGIVLPPAQLMSETGRRPDESEFLGDVVIAQGKWLKGKTIYDVIDEMKQGDVILKGANALDVLGKRAAVLIGHPEGGTAVTALRAVIGKRVRLIIPIGLEKRIFGNLDEIVPRINASETSGPRILPLPGEVFTEIDAISLLSGAACDLVAGGGVGGAEGAIWLNISGEVGKVKHIIDLINLILNEPPFEL